jgi:hypothetical protein
MVKLGLQLTLQERASLFCLIYPLSIGITNVEANIYHISVIFQLVGGQANKLYP